jgi:hypothetical protein
MADALADQIACCGVCKRFLCSCCDGRGVGGGLLPEGGGYQDDPCPVCEGSGWECYALGVADPHFRECPSCNNPEGLRSP